jgi:DNA-binding NarL/FixJ family response regulator
MGGRTVVIVDDAAGFRRAARGLLELDGFTVVGEAADGLTALQVIREVEPDIVLLDVVLPGMSGCEVAERVAGVDGAPVVVLVSSRAAEDLGPRIWSCGARGFIPKERPTRSNHPIPLASTHAGLTTLATAAIGWLCSYVPQSPTRIPACSDRSWARRTCRWTTPGSARTCRCN